MNRTMTYLLDSTATDSELFQLLNIALRAGTITDQEAKDVASEMTGITFIPSPTLSFDEWKAGYEADRDAAGLPVEKRISEMDFDEWKAGLDAADNAVAECAKRLGWDRTEDDFVRLLNESPELAEKHRVWVCFAD